MADNNTYAVGQIVYVLLRKEKSIAPMQIVEEIIRKTQDGITTAYRAAFGGRNATGAHETIMLSDIDGEIFSDLEKTRDALMQRAANSINNMVKSAETRAATWYGVSAPTVQSPQQQLENDDDGNIIRLPDGTLARLKQ